MTNPEINKETVDEREVSTVAHMTGRDILSQVDSVVSENGSNVPGFHTIVHVGDAGEPPKPPTQVEKKPRIERNIPA